MLLSLLIPLGAVAQEAYAVLDGSTLTFYYDNQRSTRSGTKYSLNPENKVPSWFGNNIIIVVFDASFANARPTTTNYWFYYTNSLTEIEGIQYLNTSSVTNMQKMFVNCRSLTTLDVSGFDTGNVTDMSSMFSGCSGLTSLDVSGFDTGKVLNMNGLFSGCNGLTSLDLSGFDTSNVTDMSFMFNGCSGLTSLDLSGFDTGNVSYMEKMFYGCSGLTSLNVSRFDTGEVTNMDCMFYDCSGLTNLDVSGFDTGKVTVTRSMFYGCSGLKSLDVSGFCTGEVTYMSYMFSGCSGLTRLDVSGFDTGKVTYMSDMFAGCSGLTSLDVSGFDTGNVTWMGGMFSGCSNLATIYCGYDWNVNAVNKDTDMFTDCTSLVGGMGTVYTSSQTGKAYAHADGGPSNPGYLTLKGGMAMNTGDNSGILEDNDGETGGVTLDGFTFSPEKWITLCLPFDATEEQAKAALGDNVDIEELNTSTWDEATQFLTLYFVPRTAIVAGMPYVVKVSATVNNPTFSGVTIKNVEPTTVYTTYCSTTGVYNATPLTVGDKSTLFIQNNRFYYPSAAGSLPATKCYFTLLGDAQQARGLGMHFWDDDDVASGIYSVTASTADQQSWYTPQGVRVSQPGKGLYIHGGKKVVVK